MKKVVLPSTHGLSSAYTAVLSALLRAALVGALWILPLSGRGQIYVTQTDASGRVPVVSEYTTAGATVKVALVSAGSPGPPWSGVVVSGENLFVMGFTGIGKYTTAGATVNAAFVTGLNPSGMAVSDDGATLFVGDSRGTIGAYNAASGAAVNRALITGLAAISGTIISGPLGIAVSGSDLYVVNPGLGAGLGTIGKYTTSGATVNASLITGLTWPQAIAVAGDNLFVTMGRTSGYIGKYTTSGATVNETLAVVNGYPQGIAVSGPNLFVVYDYNNSIGEFTLTGEKVRAPLLTGFGGAQGIAVGPDAGALAYDLTLSADPPAGGAIDANPAPSGDGKYAAGTTVNLTGTPAVGYFLQNWTGVDSDNGESAQVVMSGPRHVTASFTDMPPHPASCNCDFICCSIQCLVDTYLPDLVKKAPPKISLQAISPQAVSAGQIDLTLLRSFRDQVLAISPQGRAIVDMFYKFSPEVIYHLAVTPELRTAAAEAIVSLQPLLRDMVGGTGDLLVSSNQVSAVNALIGKLNEVGGVALKAALQFQVGQAGPLEQLVGKSSAQARLNVLGIQLQIVNPKFKLTGGLEFTVTGVLPPSTFRVEFSNDLTHWTALNIEPVTGLPALIRDDQPLASKGRYYRLVVAP